MYSLIRYNICKIDNKDFYIEEIDSEITKIHYIQECLSELKLDGIEENSDVLKKTAGQLQEYFDGKRKSFNLPLNPRGTDFQKRVWKALIEIPYGEVQTYGEIAKKVDSPKGFRAVGMACNRNPIMIIIPCHRVIGANGSLTGYAGGLHVKEYLLSVEKLSISD